MSVPYSNRTADITIPTIALKDKPRLSYNCSEFMEEMREQVPVWRSVFEAFVWRSSNTIRVTFHSANVMEEFMNRGVTFRGYPIDKIKPVSTQKWVTVLRLPYGIPDIEVEWELSHYGQVTTVKQQTHMAMNAGVRSVLMRVDHPIPSQLRVRGHWCLVFYRGQTRTCFKCGESGHEKSNCPSNRNKEHSPEETPPGPSNNPEGETEQNRMEETPPSPNNNDPGGGSQSDPPIHSYEHVRESQVPEVKQTSSIHSESEKQPEQTSNKEQVPIVTEQMQTDQSAPDNNRVDSDGFITPRSRRPRIARRKRAAPVPTDTALAGGGRKSTSPSPVRSSRPDRSRSPRPKMTSDIVTENQFATLVDEATSQYTQLVTESGNLISDRVSVDSLEHEGVDNTPSTNNN